MRKLVWSVGSLAVSIRAVRAYAKAAVLLTSLWLTACGGDSKPVVTEQQLAELRSRAEVFAGQDAAALAANMEAVALGRELFAARCVSCHGGEGGKPLRDTPNLALAVFNYGDSVAAIRTTITQGRHSVMPKHGNEMGEMELGTMVALLQSMAAGRPIGSAATGTTEFEKAARAAEPLFKAHCIECHGPEGKGDLIRGVPNLTDSYWQHGDSMMNIRMVITRGAESQCPAQGEVLSTAEIDVLTAYVLQLREQ
ncbi:MAG: c-type cytochrome [Pseudomonadales bacterium]|jgi:cytochrome c oxidase cbb3-type subunit 3|nr:c-type cytochrome [Pseudomonadales bacterium]